MAPTVDGLTPAGYRELVERQRADLRNAYLKGARRLGWDAARLATERQNRLRHMLSWAAAHASFWRDRLAGRDLDNFTEADLTSLPILTRGEMMAEFDRLVTVPGLTLDRVNQHLDGLDSDCYLDGQYRAIRTSGSTRPEAVHVYGWESFVTFVMQGSRWTGRRGEPSDAVLAQIFSCSPRHESGIFQAFSTFESGGPVSHCFSGTMSTPDLVAGLERANPPVQVLQGWPSVIRQLAKEAIAGRLTIAPGWVNVAGEVCNPSVRAAVRAAWGLELSEFWGCTEGTYAFPCGRGTGMHISDDLVILEPVDDNGRPVPFGQPAERVLLTNLFNLEQPLVRYDLTDAMTLTDEPCVCGCAHRRVASVRARMDGVVPVAGQNVPKREIEKLLLACPGLADFFVRTERQTLDVHVVVDGTCDLDSLRAHLRDLLSNHGAGSQDVRVHEARAPERLWSGKVRQFCSSDVNEPD